MRIEHIQGHTRHIRRGKLHNAFRYGVDFVLLDPEVPSGPALFSHNRFNLWSVHDRHHGGRRRQGAGTAWFRDLLARHGFPLADAQLVLLTQPGFLWLQFNPVSFWIALRNGEPCAFVAEVNNTFGDRHCYFCAHEDFRPIRPTDRMEARKIMHVSPFQQVQGRYLFRFVLEPDRIDIRIHYENGDQGVLATLRGRREPATNRSLLWAALRRPAGAARVLALIHWQALKLAVKRAPFIPRPAAPDQPVSCGYAKRTPSQ